MKPHDSGVNQWGKAFDKCNITYNNRIINAPQRVLEFEKIILCLKMLYCEDFHYNLPFSDHRHLCIYNIIEPFYVQWEHRGFTTADFVQHVTHNHYLENCGGAAYIQNIFQKLEYEGSVAL